MPNSTPYRPPLLRRLPPVGNVGNTPGRCPFLGTPADPGTSLAFPSEANHCFRSRFPIPISSIHQENYCLSAQYETCPVYRQYMNEDAAAAVVPVAAVAGGAALPEPARRPAEFTGSAIAPAMAVSAGMAVGAGRAVPVSPLDEPIYPDFPTDPGPAPEEQPARRTRDIEPRAVLLGLLLLALLALGGWAVLNFLDGRGERAGAIPGTVVALPTAAATIDFGGQAVGEAGGEDSGAGADSATVPAAASGDVAATATPEAPGQFDSVAATATALFLGASGTAECRAPEWWVPYVTQEGDTLEGLASARGMLVEEVIVANCLAGPDLAPGMELRLPPVGVIVLLPGATATLVPPTATTVSGLPTRRPPLIFPTATFPVVIIIPTRQPIVPEPPEPTGESLRPPRATPAPGTPQAPTSTPPGFFPTSTPPGFFPTSTPPTFGTVEPTKTPPGWGGAPTSTPPVP